MNEEKLRRKQAFNEVAELAEVFGIRSKEGIVAFAAGRPSRFADPYHPLHHRLHEAEGSEYRCECGALASGVRCDGCGLLREAIEPRGSEEAPPSSKQRVNTPQRGMDTHESRGGLSLNEEIKLREVQRIKAEAEAARNFDRGDYENTMGQLASFMFGSSDDAGSKDERKRRKDAGRLPQREGGVNGSFR